VQESYVRLLDWHAVHWQNRAHFFATTARMMRRVLVDAARARQAAKRGQEVEGLLLEAAEVAAPTPGGDIIALNDALAELAVEDGTFAKMTDMQKQELYETAVISTMLAKAGYEEAKKTGDDANAAIYRNLAGQTLQAVSGMPPDKVNLTKPPETEASGSQSANSSGEPIEHWTILQDYRDNQVAAAAKYNGKRITIVGAVDFILVEKGKQLARMSVPAWSGIQMFCVFAASQSAAVAKIQPNQRVVMECTVLGDTGGVTRIGRVDLGSSVGRYTLDNCLIK
jgi:hypothetical protein